MKASILINNHNYGRYLRDCIDSVLAQTYSDLEIIVVDDGSSDNSVEVIRSYRNNIVAILKERGGQASCFNDGFSRSRGDIVFFLDSDDEFHQDKVKIVMDIYKSFDIRWCFDVADQSSLPNITSQDPKKNVKLCDFRASISKGVIPHIPVPTSGLSFNRNILGKILPMLTAQGITLSDNYLKFAGAGLGAGAICNVPLTHQRIHGENRYTHSIHFKQRRAEIMVETGEQLARNFPFLSRAGIRLVSGGIAEGMANGDARFPLLFQHWSQGTFTFTEKAHITARAALKVAKNTLRGILGTSQ